MLTAKEAKQESELIHNKKVDKDYSELVISAGDAIVKAVHNGDKRISVNIAQHIVSDAVLKLIKSLEDLGYTVKQNHQSGIRTVYIDWGDA